VKPLNSEVEQPEVLNAPPSWIEPVLDHHEDEPAEAAEQTQFFLGIV
jgi:hypothetical protein